MLILYIALGTLGFAGAFTLLGNLNAPSSRRR